MRSALDARGATCRRSSLQSRTLARCRPRLTDCQPSLVALGPAMRFHGLARKLPASVMLDEEAVARSLSYLPRYRDFDTELIDTTGLTPHEVAARIVASKG